MSLGAYFKNPPKRRVGARGLQETMRFRHPCRPGPLTGRFSKHALRDRLVTHEGELAAVGRPRGDVDRSLPAEQLGEHFDLPALGRDEAQHHLLIFWMALHRL